MSQNTEFVGYLCLLAAIVDICRYVNFIQCLANELYSQKFELNNSRISYK